MSEFLREEDISAGFREPLYSVPICIPIKLNTSISMRKMGIKKPPRLRLAVF